MKSQISRDSFRPDKRYSGVYQQQGRMVLDSDGNEQAEISKERLNAALDEVIGSGIPRDGGLDIISDGAGGIEIVPGRIYVNGIPGEVISPDASSNVPYGSQPDFPGAPIIVPEVSSPPASPPEAGAYRIYADVWERTVLALEDDELLDSGLHGADTCTRTQTMVQIKWCSPDADPEDVTENPQRGSAKLSLELRAGSSSPDPCDPCADEVSLTSDVGNYLFRVEVHDVGEDAGGNPTLTIKWSSENGAEQYHVENVPTDFTSGSWLYEFYDEEAEKHLGKHLVEEAGFPTRGQLLEDFASAPDSSTHPYVRRWDGYCTLVYSGGAWALAAGVDRGVALSQTSNPVSGLGETNIGNDLSINLSAMELRLTLWEDGSDHVFLAGDFWQAVVRESEATASPPTPLLDAEEPHGIVHHYMLLAEVDGNSVNWPEGLWCNRYAFPPLTDMRASDVCFDNTCPDLFGADARTVQDALSSLCAGPPASSVRYDDPDCTSDSGGSTVRSLLVEKLGPNWLDLDGDGRTSVKDALDALLCQLDAARIPLDKTDEELCPQLAAPEVATVQQALVALCDSTGGGGCADTVGEGGKYRTLDAAIAGVAGQRTVSLCLLPGEHVLGVPFANVPETITIVGSGSTATEVRIAADYVLESAHVILRDLGIFLGANRGLRIVAAKVEVRSSTFQRSKGKRGAVPLVTVAGAKKGLLSWQDNSLLATWNETDAELLERVYMPERVLERSHPLREMLSSLFALDPGLSRAAYDRALSEAASEIATLSLEQRGQWAEESPTAMIRRLPNVPTTQLEADPEAAFDPASSSIVPGALGLVPAPQGGRSAATSFYRALAGRRPNSARIEQVLDSSIRSQISTGFDTGLATSGSEVGGSIQDSVFLCEVVLNADTRDGVEPEEKHVSDNREVVVTPDSSMRMAGNYFQRVVTRVSARTIVDDRLRGPVEGFQSLFVSDNVFYDNLSSFASLMTTMQSNHFAGATERDAAALVMGSFGVFSGNWTPVEGPRIVTTLVPDRRSVTGNLLVIVD